MPLKLALNQRYALGHATWRLMLIQRAAGGMMIVFLAICISILNVILVPMLAAVYPPALGTALSIIIACIFLFGAALIVIGIIIAHVSYTHYFFTLEEFGLKISRGIFSVKEAVIPYRQIQNVNIDQSFAYRIWGVSKIFFITAGQEEANIGDEPEGVLDPIDSKLAEALQQELESRMSAHESVASGATTPAA